MKKMLVVTAEKLREIVNFVNEFNELHTDNPIEKEDIVSIQLNNRQYLMVFFN